MSEYTHWLTAITTDRAAANRIGGIIGPSTGDGRMYTNGIPCYPAGTIFSPVEDGPLIRYTASAEPAAWAVSLAVKSSIVPFIEQFRDGGYPAPLLAAGMTAQEIDAGRAVMVVAVGARAELEPTWRDAITAAGYIMEPLSG